MIIAYFLFSTTSGSPISYFESVQVYFEMAYIYDKNEVDIFMQYPLIIFWNLVKQIHTYHAIDSNFFLISKLNSPKMADLLRMARLPEYVRGIPSGASWCGYRYFAKY